MAGFHLQVLNHAFTAEVSHHGQVLVGCVHLVVGRHGVNHILKCEVAAVEHTLEWHISRTDCQEFLILEINVVDNLEIFACKRVRGIFHLFAYLAVVLGSLDLIWVGF